MVSLVPSATKRFGEIKTSTTLTPMAINQEEASQEDASCVGSNQAQEEHQQAEHHGSYQLLHYVLASSLVAIPNLTSRQASVFTHSDQLHGQFMLSAVC